MTPAASPAVPAPAPAPWGLPLSAVGVHHIYDLGSTPVIVLSSVDLHVAAGELVAVLGPSGSGKSTLLAVLSGLLRPSSGAVLVGDRDLTQLGAREMARLRATELGVVLQEPSRNLLPYGTAVQNVAFAQRGARRHGRAVAPDTLLDDLGLGGMRDRAVHTLSGGEQQRVALARALATSPRVLLLDEPTNNLDPSSRDGVIDLLARAHELTGTTTLVVTHDDRVAAATPRTVTINSGRVGAEGRSGAAYVVVGRDGSIQLPSGVLSRHPPGTLLALHDGVDAIELRPREGGPG